MWLCGPKRSMASSFMRFLDHAQRCTTVGRTPLRGWSAQRWDLYLTTQNTHNRHLCPLGGFEPTIPEVSGRRPTPYTARPTESAPVSYTLNYSQWPSVITICYYDELLQFYNVSFHPQFIVERVTWESMNIICYAWIFLNLPFLIFIFSSSDFSFSADIIFKNVYQIDVSRNASYRQSFNIYFYSI